MNDTTNEQDNKDQLEYQLRERRKSLVRVAITYFAAIFLFLFCPVSAIILACVNQWDLAEKLIFAIIPVSGSIIAYWFGGRNVQAK